MVSLTENRKSFIKLMSKSEEHARRGFELLLKRDDFDEFFQALAAEELFDPVHNPAPISVEPVGSVRLPFWAALDYLVACAKLSDQKGDNALAEKVMVIVRRVSAFREPDGGIRDNYHTFRKFAEILGWVPTAVITASDIELVSVWLSSRFDRGMVAHALDEGAIKRLLASDVPEDWNKAIGLLRHCLGIRWEAEGQEPLMLVDPHWLKELVKHHARDFGKRAGMESATMFRDGLREIFTRGGRATWSYLFRPAVEDHGQNHSSRAPDNCFVEGLRDVMLGWCDTAAVHAKQFVGDLLHSDVEMLRRIGIHVLSERWDVLREMYLGVVSPGLFDSGHIHELHGFLKKHFEELDEQEKAATVEAIRSILPPEGRDPEGLLRQIQRRWLSAVSGTKHEATANWLAELGSDSEIGIPYHPDFNSYIESSWGPGPTPYQVQELIAFAEQRCIVEKLNAFKAENTWRGPSTEALVETLEQAVMAAPEAFIKALPTFLDAVLPYQHGVISGFKRLWDAPKDRESSANWDEAWDRLIAFFEQLLKNPDAGRKIEDGDDFTHNWLISVIADLLHAGTREDDHAYDPSLLPRAWSLLEILADRVEAVDRVADDPMFQAINSPKGRTIEALFAHVLRACRLRDKESGAHTEIWGRMKPLFDKELKKCERGNYEFSTLAGAYIASLDYIDAEWLLTNITQIFPAERPGNFGCAVGGLAYSAATRRIYVVLRDAGVLDRALRLDLKGSETRKKLVERVVLGYLWNEETLDSPRISYFFNISRVDDLEAASWFLWTIRGEQLSNEQIGKIVGFWDRCVTWALTQPNPPTTLLSSLGNLAWSLKDASGRNRDLLLAVAPHMGVHHSTHEFLGELRRLVEISPADVSTVLGRMVEIEELSYDYQDQLKSLLARLAELGQRTAALGYCNRFRNVSGMAELFKKLTSAS
jgi:hypothetical protein